MRGAKIEPKPWERFASSQRPPPVGPDLSRPSWLPADAEPSLPDDCRWSPCNIWRCCCSPMFGVVFGIIACSYGPYVLWTPHTTIFSWFCLVVFHVLVLLLIGSYVMTVFTDPGTVPTAWHEMIAADESLAADHQLCRKSKLYRPLRSHFDSVTRRVVLNMCAPSLSLHRCWPSLSSASLPASFSCRSPPALSLSPARRDHFCPWVVNAVGFYNRKFFVLFLVYTFLTCSWVLLTSLPTLLRVMKEPAFARQMQRTLGQDRYMVATMGAVLDCSLLVMLSCFMPFHVRMAMLNETTIEGPSPEFNVGLSRNWRQIFGKDPRLWFLPVWGGGPEGDGVHWPSPLVHSRVPRSSSAAAAAHRATADEEVADGSTSDLEQGRLLRRGHGDLSDSSISPGEEEEEEEEE
jgi:hypothetical protein